MPGIKGLIFDIKKFAIHDGPGIRTTVFLKGCPLGCWWCHNPEAMRGKPELVLFEEKCIGCGECFQRCPHQAHESQPDGGRLYHRDRCELCGACVETCYAEALVMEGREVSVEEVMVELRKDIPFYENSEGGITLSGGEPLHQHEFARAVFEQCKQEDLHTALDTSGQAPWRILEQVLPHVDLVLFDLKHIDEDSHKSLTGSTNRLILQNLEKTGEYGVPIEIRMPIIPGVNDTREAIERAAQFLVTVEGVGRVELLPYHRLGESKYARLEMEYKLPDLQPPEKEHMNEIADWIRPFELNVHVES